MNRYYFSLSKLLSILLIMLCCFPAYTLQIPKENESYLNKQPKDIFIYKILDDLLDKKNFKEAISMANNTFDYSVYIKSDSLKKAYKYFSLGYIYLAKGDNNNAFTNLLDAYKIFRDLKHTYGSALCKNNLALLFRYQGSYEKSLSYHMAALKEFRKRSDTIGMIEAFQYTGVVYRQTDNLKNALNYYKKALSLSVKYNDPNIISIYNLLGSYYWFQNKNDSALYFYRKALKSDTNNLLRKTRYCAVINNIGNVHRTENDFDSALYYYKKSYVQSEKYKLINLKATNLKNLGVLYSSTESLEQAKEALKQSIIFAEHINLRRILQTDYLLFSQISEKENKYEEAFNYYKKYAQVRDSALDLKHYFLNKQFEADHLFDLTAKQKALIQKNRAENDLRIKSQQMLLIIAISSIIILVAVIVFILFLYNTNKKAKEYFKNMNKVLEEKVRIRTFKLNNEVIEHKNTSKKLLKAKKKAEESDKLKSAFLSNMSHEIRTPMNSIIGFSDLLNEPDLDEDNKRKFVKLIQTNGNTLLKLIDDIIDIAKIEANQVKINKQNCDIHLLLDNLYQNFKSQSNKALSFRITKARKSCSIITDEFRLQQVLLNLLSNAFKFTSEGSINMGYKIDKQEQIVFYVKDTGIGISEEGKSQVFERFRQDKFSKSELYQGTGLGLAISKNLIKLLGGKIWLDSELNIGSAFYFSLPFKEVKTETPKDDKKTEAVGLNWNMKNILISEDIDESFELIQVYLNPSKINIHRARNGEEAIQVFREKTIDLILMDIQMPKMNGIEATKKIKKINPNIPIIATTAYALADEKRKCEKAGCDAFVSKPINRIKLLDLIGEFLNN